MHGQNKKIQKSTAVCILNWPQGGSSYFGISILNGICKRMQVNKWICGFIGLKSHFGLFCGLLV